MAISNGGQCPQLNSGLGTSHGWLSSMWIERSDTLIHALGYNTTLFAGQSEGWYVLILVPKKLEDLETFNAVLQRGARQDDSKDRVKRQSGPVDSTFQKLAPSNNRYSFRHDEF